MNQTALLAAAVNELVQAEDASSKLDAIEAITPAARRYTARLTGELEVLNPLVELAVSSPDKYQRMLVLVDEARARAGLLPLRAKKPFDKRAWVRDTMEQRRIRERRAADIENMTRAYKDRLTGQARMNFMQAQYNRWAQRYKEMLAEAQEQVGGEHLPRPLRAEIKARWWAEVDAELDAKEEQAKRRRISGDASPVAAGVSYQRLLDALRDK